MIVRAGVDGQPYRMSHHYLIGYIRLEQEDYAGAVAELKQAGQADIFIQWLLARAHRGMGQEPRRKGTHRCHTGPARRRLPLRP